MTETTTTISNNTIVPSIKDWIDTLPDTKISENAKTVLERRYLRRDENLELTETPKELFARVAHHVAQGNEERAAAYYDFMTSCTFMPNSPTLFNAGTNNGLGLSACYILVPQDSLESITQVKSDLMKIQKSGGGVGYDFSHLRPKGSLVKSCGATTDGPIPFIDSFCWDTAAIQQGAKRRGAQMGMLWIWHPDIWDFIHAKTDLSRWQNMNVSPKVTDEFMVQVTEAPDTSVRVYHEKWGNGLLMRTPEGEVKAVQYENIRSDDGLEPVTAGELFTEIVSLAWENGEPGLGFWDRVEKDWVFKKSGKYPIEATNPCGEIPGEDGMSCNLGSINLAQFVENGVFNHDRFVAAIQMGVEFLDNVVSVNQFPVEKIAQMNQETRRIGLGVMGFADLLFQLGIPYDSDEARGFAKSLARTLKEEAFYASVALADEKGAFPAHKDSDYSGGLIPRNAYQTMIAPTGSISILADCSCGIEPIFSLAFEREVMQTQDGSRAKMTEVNPYFKRALEVLAHNMPEIINVEDAIERAIGFVATTGSLDYFTGELSRSKDWKELVKIFQTARDVSMEGHVLMQAAWQEGLDQACSKTINLPADASVEDVEKAYKLAWENGCKGITVYRDGCRDGKQGQVQPMRLAKKEEEEISEIGLVLEELFREQDLGRGQLEELPDIAEALKVKQRTPLGTLHVHIVHEGGEFKEIFGQITKSGDQPAADLEAICRLSSLILRLGGTTDMVLKQLEHIGTSQLMPTADGKIKSIPDGLAVALKRAQKELQNSADKEWVTESVSRTIEIQRKETALYKEVCPDCGSVLKMESGCQGCSDPKCGYTRC